MYPGINRLRSYGLSAFKVTFNFIQNLGGGGGYGDASNFKEGQLVVQKNHT